MHPHDTKATHLLLPVPFGLLLGAGPKLLQSGELWLAGWAVAETTGIAAAVLSVFDGSGAANVPVAVINLSPGQSSRDFFGGHLLKVRSGLTVVATSGSVSGTFYLAAA